MHAEEAPKSDILMSIGTESVVVGVVTSSLHKTGISEGKFLDDANLIGYTVNSHVLLEVKVCAERNKETGYQKEVVKSRDEACNTRFTLRAQMSFLVAAGGTVRACRRSFCAAPCCGGRP